jgi:radical SAM protein with 4Fe4S-binding SPASM domain
MNNQLFQKKYLNRLSSIEFVISEKCQNACKYCYRVKHHNKSKITHISIDDFKLMFNNISTLFNKNIYKYKTIELFGGDPVLNYDILCKIFKFLNKELSTGLIVIPTNSRLIQELTFNDIRKMQKYAGNIRVAFSLSVDGEIIDSNRELSKYGKMHCYDTNIDYDYLKILITKFGKLFAFHPMLHFNTVETWEPTIKFFYEKFKLVPYLLEVRHSVSSEDAIKAVNQLVNIRKYLKSLDKYKNKTNFGNTISPSICPRGLGCSGLTTLCIMPNGDIPFCHRLVETPYVYGNIYKKQFNKEMAITYTSLFDFHNLPLCMECVIRNICSGQCLGANFEYWGDAFIMNPTICNYFKLKNYAMYNNFKSWKKTLSNQIDYNRLKTEIKMIFGDDIDDKI